MKRNHNNTTSIDDNDKRHKITGDGIGSYTLVFADGSTILFDPAISAKSSVLSNLDPDSPVPISQFHVATARALLTLLASDENDMSYASHLTPEMYVKILQLCDYLGMAEIISTTLLLHLEPAVQEDPLARLRACHFQLPIFSRILYQRYDTVFENEEHASQAVARLVTSSPEHLTYVELNCCDGIFFAKKKKHLHLYRFAATERARRQSIQAAAAIKTKALRALLNTNNEDGVAQDALCVALLRQKFRHFFDATATTTRITKDFLDDEMWKAIEQGRVDVAQRLFDLGAEPALRRKPIHGTTFDYDDMSDEGLYDEDMTDKDFDTTLMVATRNDDLNMMKWLMDVAGCDADLKQPTLTTHDGRVNGGLNSLWVAKSKSAMQLLLSRGCDANQKCEIEYNCGDSNVSASRQRPLLLGDGYMYTDRSVDTRISCSLVSNLDGFVISNLVYVDRNVLESRPLLSDSWSIGGQLMGKMVCGEGVQENTTIVSCSTKGNRTTIRLNKDIPSLPNYVIKKQPADPNRKQIKKNKFLSTGSCTVNKEKEKLLIQHGADPNVFQMTCHGDEQDASECEWAYWPTLLQQQTVDMEWCSKLLKIYGASPNWPYNIEPNECGDVPCGPTILLQAVLDNKLEVARMLLRHNADPNLFEMPGWTNDQDGQTKCHFIPHSSDHACGLFKLDSSNSVLPDQYDYDAKNRLKNFLQCPLSAAIKLGNKEMIQLLKKHGATADSPIDIDTYIVLNPAPPMKGVTYLTQNAPEAFKTNKHCVMVSVAEDPHSLSNASDELKNDKDVIMCALENSSGEYWLQHMSDGLKDDREFMSAIIANHPFALSIASDNLKNNKEFIMVVVAQNSSALEYVSDTLKQDPAVVAACKNHGGGRTNLWAEKRDENERRMVLNGYTVPESRQERNRAGLNVAHLKNDEE